MEGIKEMSGVFQGSSADDDREEETGPLSPIVPFYYKELQEITQRNTGVFLFGKV